MTISLFRVLLLVASLSVGYKLGGEFGATSLVGALFGGGVAIVVIAFEIGTRKASFKDLAVGTVGLILGLLVANLISIPFYLIPLGGPRKFVLPLISNIVLGYFGLISALKRKESFSILPLFRAQGARGAFLKILDTSAIIDGRIADICSTKFVEGTLIVPRFVLRELQLVADSSDQLKRKRGRRGLEILEKLQKDENVKVVIQDTDYPDIRDVDSKLVRLAREMDACIVTNDYNLNKVASLEKIIILNTNELANAMKPIIIPGEVMTVRIVKEGREANQGVGYLDDGTMVVVENARRHTGATKKVVVTSALQTPAGRMIFGLLQEDAK